MSNIMEKNDKNTQKTAGQVDNGQPANEVPASEQPVNEEGKMNKDEIVGDIIANNPLIDPSKNEEEVRTFTKKEVFETREFSWLRLNEFLDYKLQNLSAPVKLLVECLTVTFLFMLFPIATLALKSGTKIFSTLTTIIMNNKGGDSIDDFVKAYIFLTLIYVVYSTISLFSENILYTSLLALELFRVQINEGIIEILQVIRSTSYYWSTCLTCIIIFVSHNYLIEEYAWFSGSTGTSYIFLTILLWYGCLMGILFVEKFFMNFCTAEIRRREYRGRIWDINYKTFVFKKLVAISKASKSDRQRLGNTIVNDYDPGFYIKHNDLKFYDKKDAKDIAESIFAYLNVQQLKYKDLQIYFPDNHKEVYEYLGNKKMQDEDKFENLSFERIQDEIIKLLVERNDMIRTLTDRESIFNKLDLILQSVSIYVSLLIFAILFGIDYKVYLASIGPAFFTFGWIFSDTIKEIYNCFVFLLVQHPYDVGDRVIVDGTEYTVSKTDVLATTFVDCNGKTVYIPTPSLFGKTICNMRRSRQQSEALTILVDKTTSFEKAIKLKDQISKKLAENKNDFTGYVTLSNFEIAGNDLSISLFIQHITNFQQMEEKLKRRETCTLIIQKCLKEASINYNNSFKYVD